MIAVANQRTRDQQTDWHEGFLELLPRIERYAHLAFRRLPVEAKEDAVCEVIANCLCAYRRLFERNKLDRAFASVLVRYAAALYYRGCRIGTPQCSRDLYSTQSRRDEKIELRSVGTPRDQRADWLECLVDNSRTPVPDQAHFRIEFPRWLSFQTRRNRRVVEKLVLGCSTAEVARQFKISSGRVSQLRREFYDSWEKFTGDTQPKVIAIRSQKR